VVEPELWIGVEISSEAETESGFGGDAPAFVDDFADARGRDAEFEGEFVDGEVEGLHEVLAEDFAGVDGGD